MTGDNIFRWIPHTVAFLAGALTMHAGGFLGVQLAVASILLGSLGYALAVAHGVTSA